MKIFYLALLAFVCSVSLSACNTLEGAGEDIQQGGQAIEDAAE